MHYQRPASEHQEEQELVPEKEPEIRKPKQEITEKDALPMYVHWLHPLMIFLLVLLAYLVISIQGITVNEVTRFWAIAITFMGAAVAIAYHYRNEFK